MVSAWRFGRFYLCLNALPAGFDETPWGPQSASYRNALDPRNSALVEKNFRNELNLISSLIGL